MNRSSIKRILLGLEQPPLVTAAQRLNELHQADTAAGKTLDMSNCLIVVPTGRSRHRLMQLLAAEAQQSRATFSPPQITTLGDFPEHLYVLEKTLASDLAQQIAWSRALEETSLEQIQCLTGREDVEELKDWQPLARVLSTLHTRLASDVWSFSSVAREVSRINNFLPNEMQRWDVLKEVQRSYYKILGKADLWDRQAARNWIAAGSRSDVNEQRCFTDKEIVMVATADINRSIAGMLAQLTSPITVMIAAAEQHSDRFDEYGNLITKRWLSASIEIPDEKILFVDSPADQASGVVDFITHQTEDYATDEVTIGVPSEDLIPQLQRSVNSIDVPSRNLAGKPLAETAPVRLMLACREYFQQQDYDSFATLSRHPDLHRWVCQQIDDQADSDSNSDWLDALDRYQNNNLPDRIPITEDFPFGDPVQLAKRFTEGDSGSKHRATENARNATRLNRVHDLIRGLLKPLDHSTRPITDWTEPWTNLLITVYGQRELDRDVSEDQQVLQACQAIHDAFANHRQVPEEFGTKCTAVEALEWALDAATEQRVVDPPIDDAIEFAGWLDLPLDDAPLMAIIGMNDEHVPSSEIGHQFLPNQLCEQLGILDNDRRFARDVYAMTVITSVRENYLLIAGRNDAAKDPLKPSRLFFTQDELTSAQRAYAFFSFEGESETNFWLLNKESAEQNENQQFKIPRPAEFTPPTSLTVTRFREYLKCPYRFYLNCIMRLETVTDDWTEMSGGTFGDLAHDVLQAFAESDAMDSKNEDDIFAFLSSELDREARKRFPGSQLPALRIQLEQLRQRLRQFSTLQAKQRQDGWRIVSCEELLEHTLIVDGKPFVIRGKIDRVDQHKDTGQVAVWDYKTSDSGKTPEQAHRKSKQWTDLQLPLYRHLLKEVSVLKDANLDDVLLGYVLLSKKIDEIAFVKAPWDISLLENADKTAFECIRNIRDGVFGPPAEKPPEFSEDFAAICQDNVFEQDEILPGEWGDQVQEVAPW